MNFFPPLLINRIKIVENDSDFMNLKVRSNILGLIKIYKKLFSAVLYLARLIPTMLLCTGKYLALKVYQWKFG